jgi:hypothetical protein
MKKVYFPIGKMRSLYENNLMFVNYLLTEPNKINKQIAVSKMMEYLAEERERAKSHLFAVEMDIKRINEKYLKN